MSDNMLWWVVLTIVVLSGIFLISAICYLWEEVKKSEDKEIR